jgi:ABC-2 type transport system ATP-binding protein
VWRVIRDLKTLGKTIFLTTHYMEEAHVLADRIAIINHGKIVGIGRPSELIEAHGGSRSLVVRGNGDSTIARIQREFANARLVNGQDVVISVKSIHEIENALHVLAEMGFDAQVEIRNPTIEDVFLSLIGARIGEEGELA